MRTVGVKLTSEVSDYVKGTRAAGAATGDLADKIGEAKRESVAATAATDRLGRAVNVVAGDEAKLAREADRAAEEVKRFGVSSVAAARHVDQLGDEIKNVERELVVMHAALTTAGSAADRLDISKAIRRTEADLKKMNKSRGVLSAFLPSDAEVGKEGSKVGARLMAGVGDGVRNAASGSFVMTAAAVLGTTLAPMVGGLVAAAVVGGSGGLGIIGGVVLASKDPRVKAAGADLGTSIMADLQARSTVFVGPVVESIGDIKRAYAGMSGDIGKTFQVLSGEVRPLTNSLLRAGTSVAQGVMTAARASGPVLSALGRLSEGVGKELGDMFTTLAKDAPMAASAVDDLGNALINTGHAVTVIIDGLAHVKGGLDMFDNGIDSARYGIEDFFTKLAGGRTVFDITADGYKKGSEAAELYRKGVIGAAGSVNDYEHYLHPAVAATNDLTAAALTGANGLQSLAEHMDDVTESARSMFDADTSVGEAMDRVTAAAKKNGHTLDSSTEKGRANREALSGLAKALQKQYQATVDVNGVGPRSDAVAASNRASFIRLATSMTGSSRQARILADQILGIPVKHDTKIHADPQPAITAVRRAQAAINSLHGKTVYITVKQSGNIHVSGPGGSGTQVKGSAVGGPVTGPGPKGRDSELRMLAPGEHVWTAAEVDAAGGHGAVMRLRSSALGSVQRHADGGPVSGQSVRVMPAAAGGTTVQVIEHRVTFADTQNEIGQLLVKAIRTSPGVRAEMAQRLGVRTAG